MVLDDEMDAADYEAKRLALENSVLLDVHTWSDHPETDAFVNPIYEAYFRGNNEQIRKKHVKVLLLHLYVTWAEDPMRYTALHRNSNAYRARSRYNELHISRLTIDVVDALREVGLIDMELGWLDRERGIGRLSRIRPTEALIQRFAEARFTPLDVHHHHEGRKAVILRNAQKDQLEFEDTEQTLAMEAMLQRYNALLRRTFIDIPDLSSEELLAAHRNGRTQSQRRKFVRRVFHRSSFDFGGRFFGGWWQNCPKEWRSRIFINDQPTNEIDFAAQHIVMLYALEGVSYWSQIGRDPYAVEHFDFLGDDPRAAIKTLVLVSLNASGEREAFNAFRDKMEAGNPLKRLANDQLGQVMRALREAHPQIAHYFNADMGVRLMRYDSDITAQVLDHFTADDVPVLSMHDSYIVPSGYEDELRRQMEVSFQNVMNVELGGMEGGPQLREEQERVQVLEDVLMNWQPYDGYDMEEEQEALHQRIRPERTPRYNAERELFETWRRSL